MVGSVVDLEGGVDVKPYYQASGVTIYHGDARELVQERYCELAVGRLGQECLKLEDVPA